jgi:hypothetical protein
MVAKITNHMTSFHSNPTRLLTAATILSTSDRNQKKLTAFSKVVVCLSDEIWIVVARVVFGLSHLSYEPSNSPVIALKRVATVIRLSKLLILDF